MCVCRRWDRSELWRAHGYTRAAEFCRDWRRALGPRRRQQGTGQTPPFLLPTTEKTQDSRVFTGAKGWKRLMSRDISGCGGREEGRSDLALARQCPALHTTSPSPELGHPSPAVSVNQSINQSHTRGGANPAPEWPSDRSPTWGEGTGRPEV